jgi:outer membrane protein assembly factor BamB
MRSRLLPWLLLTAVLVLAFKPVSGFLHSLRRVEEIKPTAVPSAGPLPIDVGPHDAPWWRGLDRNGIATGPPPRLPFQLPADRRWETVVPGRGHASPIVCRESVYLLTADETALAISLLAYRSDDGTLNWQRQLHAGGFEKVHIDNTHASATPACDGQAIYCACLIDKALRVTKVDLTGKIVWQTVAGPYDSYHGYGASVVLYDSLVIVGGDNPGLGFIAGLDRATGEVVWRTARGNQPSHSSPMIAHTGGVDQLFYHGQRSLVSYDPRTGAERWRMSGTSDETANTVATDADFVYVSGGYPQTQVQAVRADGSRELIWERKINVYVPSLLVSGERLLAVTDNGVIRMLSAATGKDLWTKRLGGEVSASPIAYGDTAVVINEDGKGVVFKMADQFKAVGEFELGDRVYATPAIAGGRIFLRTASKLICINGAESVTE